jgi:hypothetical protein
MPPDDCGGLDQHHCVEATRPQPVQADPDQAVDSEHPEPTGALAPENHDLMA